MKLGIVLYHNPSDLEVWRYKDRKFKVAYNYIKSEASPLYMRV